MQGTLITFHGINNIGKSTHAKRLTERLNEIGYDAIYIKYPVYDIEPTGPLLNKILRSDQGQQISEDELQLWFVMNRYQYEPALREALESGAIVIAEDYIGTGIAWGATKGLEIDWLESVNKFLIQPDFSVILEGERAMKSKEEGHLHEQDDDLVERSRKVHQELAEKYGWHRITLQPEKEHTADLVFNAVDAFLKQRYS